MARSVSENGRFEDVHRDLSEVVKAMPNAEQTKGRRAVLAVLDGVADDAGPDAIVNASYNYARGTTGQIDVTTVVSVVPARPPIAATR